MRRQLVARKRAWRAGKKIIRSETAPSSKALPERNDGRLLKGLPCARTVLSKGTLRVSVANFQCAKGAIHCKCHHTLLHMETAPKTKGTNKVPKDVTYTAPSKGSKEVLWMTCRVEVTAPDSTVTQAKALLDCAASTSLIMECLTNKLRLPRQRSNHHIKGVVGFNVRPREQ